MLVRSFAAGMASTNCYIVALDSGRDAVIIDSGQSAYDEVKKVLHAERLNPVAVLLTHGHIDHTWDAQALCDEYAIPAYIHADDRAMLTDPGSGLSRELALMLEPFRFQEPQKVYEVNAGDQLDLAGMRFTVDTAPGHSRGSVIFTTTAAVVNGVDIAETSEQTDVCFSGDILFAGGIGWTDIPGGNQPQLIASIREKLLSRRDGTVVLSGHGPSTTVGQERRTNPFLG